MSYFYGRNSPKWRVGSKAGNPSWKLDNEPYHIPIHGKTLLRAILVFFSYLSMAMRPQKCTIFMAKIAPNGGLVPGQRNPPGNWLMSHITSQSMEKHYIWPFKPSSGTYPWQWGLKNALFYDKSSPKWAPNGPYHITIHEKTLLKYTWSKIIVANI